MNPIFISFFNKQKNQVYSIKLNKKINNNVKENSYGNTTTYIFSQYLFIESVLNKEIEVPMNNDYNLYSSFIQFSSTNYPIYSEKNSVGVKIDSFAFYMAIQLTFKVTHTVISTRPNDLTFFCYYNKAFIHNFSIGKVAYNNNILITNKYKRLDYQQKYQNRIRTNFIGYGNDTTSSFFNTIFYKNNTPQVNIKNRTHKLFFKKLRSTKAIRKATLGDDYNKRFKSNTQITSFIKLYVNSQIRKRSIFKPKAIFPQHV